MNGRTALPLALPFVITLACLSACSTFNNVFQGDKLDYRSKSSSPTTTLEVPPDLSTLPKGDRYSIPERAGTTLSSYNAQKPATGTDQSAAALLPNVSDARLEHAGGQRWLVVNKKPEEIWSTVREFWQDSGFLIKTESQETGIIETDWAENRAKIPLDIIRSTIGKVFDSLYSTGELDKFRTRIERTADGGSEIYISHRGMTEVYTNAQKDSTIWQPRPSDPELEAEFLRRLLVRFGVDPERAKTVVASPSSAAPVAVHAKLVSATGAPSYLEVDDAFDRAWRRVGLALDRVGFTVEDRDRNQGIYFVRYVDPKAEINQRPGLFSRIFKSEDKLSKPRNTVFWSNSKGTHRASRCSASTAPRKPEASPKTSSIS